VLRVDNATASDVTRDDEDASDDVTRGGGGDWRHSVHFDVGDQLYVGGLPSSARPPHLGRHVRSRAGFVGCLAAVDLDGDDRPLLEQGADLPRQYRDEIIEGCEGLSLHNFSVACLASDISQQPSTTALASRGETKSKGLFPLRLRCAAIVRDSL